MSDEFETEAELGFEPAVPVTGRDTKATTAPSADGAESSADDTASDAKTTTSTVARDAAERRRRGSRTGGRSAALRRVRAIAVLIAGLFCMGAAYATFATSSGATENSGGDSAAQGRQIYQVSCIACHGQNLQGVQGRGPSLIAVGGASVYFQVSTGRMPATGQGATEMRKTPKFTEEQTQQLAAYVESIGGGPQIPTGNLRSTNLGEGGQLFRTNCASCHGTTGKGAPLSAGKVAPSLNAATDKQIYTAMLSGPENMPVFSNNTLTPDQKKEIIAYIQTLKASKDPGGSGIDRIGPVSEALVIWVGGVGALMIAILWIGAKSQ